MKIIGFSGKKQSGKTTAAEFLVEKWPTAHFYSFADGLKRLVCDYFLNPAEGYDADYYTTFTGEKIKNKKHLCGLTYRELLQRIGTDCLRGIWPDVWVAQYRYWIEQIGDKEIITPDVRFPNEVKCIQDLGGHVIRLLRAPFPDDCHESETALDEMEERGTLEFKPAVPQNWLRRFDAVIDNRNMTITEQNEAVWKLCQERKWL
jgi:hypothetical protein